MAKYKIAWQPGDGIGEDVIAGTNMILDSV